MRYTVKLFTDRIVNVMASDDLSEVVVTEHYYRNLYGKDKVWICDNIQEILVG